MAATVSTIRKALSSYVRADQDLLDFLNMVLPRLYNMGYWKDLLYQYAVITDHAYITLPWDAASIVAANVGSHPAGLANQWQDYRTMGSPSTGVSPIYGLVDDGYLPTISDLSTETTYQLQVESLVSAADSRPADGKVYVEYLNEDDDVKRHSFSLGAPDAPLTTFTTPDRVTSIREIRFSNVSDTINVSAVPTNTALATILVAEGRGDEVCRYRRFRLTNPSSESITVLLLLKRGFANLMHESDVVYLSDINTLKHGILATVAEDNADIERANYHWGVCKMLLEDQKDAVKGMIRIHPSIDPTGGIGYGIPNMT
jgi:hypothetical protein